jgi:hypothetical protein
MLASKINAPGKGADKRQLQVNDINCPRCHNAFSCNAANIKQCQCWGIELNVDDLAYLLTQGFSAQQAGCLCRKCLLEIQKVVKKS